MAGINWTLTLYKLLASAMLLVGVGIVAYREGKHDCENAANQDKITVLETQIVSERQIVIQELDKREKSLVQRLAKLQEASVEAATMKAELQQIREELKNAIKNRPGNSACAPSADELRQYDEISKRTKRNR